MVVVLVGKLLLVLVVLCLVVVLVGLLLIVVVKLVGWAGTLFVGMLGGFTVLLVVLVA